MFQDENPDRIFLVREFFPSQKYYFHEDWQMEMVGMMCPFISKMLFIFHEVRMYLCICSCIFSMLGSSLRLFNITLQFLYFQRCVSDFTVALSHFSNLTELELFGGSFYLHKVPELLEVKGFRLKSLTLTSMKQIDYKGNFIIVQNDKCHSYSEISM